jgi:hypothetical protein
LQEKLVLSILAAFGYLPGAANWMQFLLLRMKVSDSWTGEQTNGSLIRESCDNS